MLSLSQASAAIHSGDLRPSELIESCLQRIDRFESSVRAWTLVDRAGSRRAARRLEEELARGRLRGPLHGIPLGIKDIFDVTGLPTRAGSRLRTLHVAQCDAEIVARLRRAGAVILGKLATTEFASFDPAPTRNPWNLAHTPGGSSAGSAAAVAMGMCFGALGTQTGGSIIRPAAYCGVAGFKPTYGRVSLDGVVPLAENLDHVGALARRVDDLELLFTAMTEMDDAAPPGPLTPPRLGVLEGYFLETADSEIAGAVRSAMVHLESLDARVEHVALPLDAPESLELHRRVMAVEAASYHRERFLARQGAFGPQLTALLDEGINTSASDYNDALAEMRQFRQEIGETFRDVDAWALPATPTVAPPRLDTTGDPRFNSPWSFLGLPAVTFPIALSATGMPIGLQLIGPPGRDVELLRIAAWCERQLPFYHQPPCR